MGDNDAETFANVTRADYDLEDEAFDAISNDAKNFISGLLIKRKEYISFCIFLIISGLFDLVICNKFKISFMYSLAQITYVSHKVLGTSVDDTTCYGYEQSPIADRETKEIHHTEKMAGVY